MECIQNISKFSPEASSSKLNATIKATNPLSHHQLFGCMTFCNIRHSKQQHLLLHTTNIYMYVHCTSAIIYTYVKFYSICMANIKVVQETGNYIALSCGLPACPVLSLSCPALSHTFPLCSDSFFYDSAVTWGHFCWHSAWRRPVESINQIDWQLRSCRASSEECRIRKTLAKSCIHYPFKRVQFNKAVPKLALWARAGGWWLPLAIYSRVERHLPFVKYALKCFLRLSQWREFMQIFMAWQIVAWSEREKENERESV